MDNSRTAVSDTDLNSLVFLYVDESVVNATSFTKADITRAIRAANPGLEIDHARVRAEVARMYRDGEMVGYEAYPDRTISGSPMRYCLATAAIPPAADPVAVSAPSSGPVAPNTLGVQPILIDDED